MVQKVYCECGEASMLRGRCIKCKRVRPSSEEIWCDISKLDYDIMIKNQQLVEAYKLEEEDINKRQNRPEKARTPKGLTQADWDNKKENK